MKSVLIVEDDRNNVDMFSTVFQRLGFHIETAIDGNEAVERLQSFIPDIVVLDLNMPGLNGLEVLKIIRQDSRIKHIKVIIATANHVAERTDEAKLADLFLMKPISPIELGTLAERLLK